MDPVTGRSRLRLTDIEDGEPSATAGPVLRPRARRNGVLRTLEAAPKASLRYDGIGADLAVARVAAGMETADVARTLRIRRQYLEAIEEGRYRDLPGLTYAIGYVRSYAQFLGTDSPNAVARFKAETQGLAEPTELVFPSPAPEGKVPGRALIFISAVLAGLLYGGWYYLSTSNQPLADLVPVLPDRLAALIGTDSSLLGSNGSARQETVYVTRAEESYSMNPAHASVVTDRTPTPPVAVAGAEAAAAAPSLMGESASSSSAAPAPSSSTASPAASGPSNGSPSAAPRMAVDQAPIANPPAAATEPPAAQGGTAVASLAYPPIPAAPTIGSGGTTPARPSTQSAATAHILIRATADSWVQVRDTDSTTLMTRVMRAGDQYEVPDRPGLKLFTGNAGALEILVNGREIPKLGGYGKVARNIPLDGTLLARPAN
jgi:cytoskeleton protein RodZ